MSLLKCKHTFDTFGHLFYTFLKGGLAVELLRETCKRGHILFSLDYNIPTYTTLLMLYFITCPAYCRLWQIAVLMLARVVTIGPGGIIYVYASEVNCTYASSLHLLRNRSSHL